MLGSAPQDQVWHLSSNWLLILHKSSVGNVGCEHVADVEQLLSVKPFSPSIPVPET